MEDLQMDRKKKWVLKVCAGFLVVMVLATILSRAAASVLVAEVQTGRVQRGRLSYFCEGDGTVIPIKKEQIFLWDGQQVEWAAKPGSLVKKGECLVRFRMEYLEEMIEKKEDELLQLELQAAQQQISARETARVPQMTGASQTLDDARREFEDARKKEKDAKEALADFKSEAVLEESLQDIRSEAVPEESLQDTKSEAVPEENVQDMQKSSSREQKKQELEAALNEAKERTKAAKQAVRQAQNACELARMEDEAQAQNEANSEESARLSAEAAQAQVSAAEKALRKLRKYEAAEGKITAGKNCIVLTSGVQPGAITTGTEVLETGNGGFCLEGKVKTADKEKLKEGVEISVQFQTGGKKTAVLESVTSEAGTENSDSQNGDAASGGAPSGLFWRAPLPDNLETEGGETFTWSVKASSEKEYEQIIPLSALREDISESYCLILSEEKQMLGTVQTARRVPVTVLEKDGENAAVSSTLQETDKLIISSDKYVEEGDRVRIKE